MPTSNFNVTRNEIITLALQNIGVLADGESASGDQITNGIKSLNLIVRELDTSGKWLWGISQTPSTVTLVANQFVYTAAASAIPTDLLQLVRASYRDAQANDWPLDILTTEGYESIGEKVKSGDPRSVFLPEHKTLSSKTLFVWPMLTSVNTQSVVTGTDAAAWKCIKSHTSDSTNKPITGANYLLYWESGGSGPSSWATATSYTAPQQVRLWYKRPLYDFDAASDNPDFPQQWSRLLIYRLSADLADMYRKSLEERTYFIQKAKGAYEDIYKNSVPPNTTDYHNFTSYY